MDKSDDAQLPNGGYCCSNCKHVRLGELKADLSRGAICTRYPPTVVGGLILGPTGDPSVIANTVFPSFMNPDRNWCGEHAPQSGKRH